MVQAWISPDKLAYPDSEWAQTAVEYATYVLYRLTGEKYPGISRTLESYVQESKRAPREDPTASEIFANTQAIGVPRSVQYPQRLYLRGTPVHQVHAVYRGDTLIDPAEYTLYNKRFLKLNTGAMWDYGCTDTGITVDYSYGMLPPKAGALAATTLANELLILLGEGGNYNDCRIPERVKSVNREGISFDLIDPMEFMDDGRTGIWEIDLFIRTSNPAKSKKQPRILSPNDPRRYRK